MKSGQHKSSRAPQFGQLLFWEFFKLLRKIKSNFGISILPQFKLEFSPKLEFEIQTILIKFITFLSKSEFEPKRNVVVNFVLHISCFGRFLIFYTK